MLISQKHSYKVDEQTWKTFTYEILACKPSVHIFRKGNFFPIIITSDVKILYMYKYFDEYLIQGFLACRFFHNTNMQKASLE